MRTDPHVLRSRLFASLLAACSLSTASACVVDSADDEGAERVADNHMSFEEFLETVGHDHETGAYIVEGDIPVRSLEELKAYYEAAEQPSALTVSQYAGVDNVWSSSGKLTLTYCVSSAGFGVSYTNVVSAMREAANAWELAANVDFHHVSSEDASCTASNNNVVFSVELTSGQLYNAIAFFPNQPRAERRLRIDYANATSAAPKTLAGILKHELGHILGFRHEHIRGTCSEGDSDWRAVTAYDSASVMHYPPYSWSNCGGTNTGDYSLTQLDREGASTLYGAANRPYRRAVAQRDDRSRGRVDHERRHGPK